MNSLVRPDFDAHPKLIQKDDGWYLSMAEDRAWSKDAARKVVTTKLLHRTKLSDMLFENPDGSPILLDTDYFGRKRDLFNPFPGPFESAVDGEVKVWPKN